MRSVNVCRTPGFFVPLSEEVYGMRPFRMLAQILPGDIHPDYYGQKIHSIPIRFPWSQYNVDHSGTVTHHVGLSCADGDPACYSGAWYGYQTLRYERYANTHLDFHRYWGAGNYQTYYPGCHVLVFIPYNSGSYDGGWLYSNLANISYSKTGNDLYVEDLGWFYDVINYNKPNVLVTGQDYACINGEIASPSTQDYRETDNFNCNYVTGTGTLPWDLLEYFYMAPDPNTRCDLLGVEYGSMTKSITNFLLYKYHAY